MGKKNYAQRRPQKTMTTNSTMMMTAAVNRLTTALSCALLLGLHKIEASMRGGGGGGKGKECSWRQPPIRLRRQECPKQTKVKREYAVVTRRRIVVSAGLCHHYIS